MRVLTVNTGSSSVKLRVLDADALRLVEGGDTLAVDRGALTVARRLFEQCPQQLSPQLELRSVLAPRLSAYPLWFLAVVDDGDRGFTKVQVYERHSAAASWHLVETAEVLEFLRAARCDQAQGYHLARPMPLAQLRGVIG